MQNKTHRRSLVITSAVCLVVIAVFYGLYSVIPAIFFRLILRESGLQARSSSWRCRSPIRQKAAGQNYKAFSNVHQLELRIWSRKSNLHFSDEEILTFEEAYRLATEQGKIFAPSEHLSSAYIFIELQKALNQEIRNYWVLAIQNWETKEKLIPPENADEELANQYNLANAILGYKDLYELLSDETKGHFDSCKHFVEGIVARNH